MVKRTRRFLLTLASVLIAMVLLVFLVFPVSWFGFTTNLVVTAAFASSLIFVIGYTAFANWWEHDLGITFVILDLGLTVSLFPTVLHVVFNMKLSESVFFARYFIVSLALVAIGVSWRAYIMLKKNLVEKVRVYRDGKKEEQHPYKAE